MSCLNSHLSFKRPLVGVLSSVLVLATAWATAGPAWALDQELGGRKPPVTPVETRQPAASQIRSTRPLGSLNPATPVAPIPAGTSEQVPGHPLASGGAADPASPAKPAAWTLGSGLIPPDPLHPVAGPFNLPLNQPIETRQTQRQIQLSLDGINSGRVTAWLVDEAGKAEILADREGQQPFEPATASKLLTALVAYDALADRLDEQVTLQELDFAGLEGARMAGLVVGEQVPVVDLFYATILASGGEAAQALARLAYGTHDAFVEQMNTVCQQLGLKDSVFSNATGLSAAGDHTTTEDLVRITAAAASRPLLERMMRTADYTTQATTEHPQGLRLESILFQDIAQSQAAQPDRAIYIQGGRPGWSPNGLFTLTGFARVGRQMLVIVTAGADSAANRFSDQVALYQQLVGENHEVTLFSPHQVLAELPLADSGTDRIPLERGDEAITVELPVILTAEDVELRYDKPAELTPPVAQGDPIGRVQAVLNGQLLYEETFYAARDYQVRTLAGVASGLSHFYEKTPVGFILLFLILIAGLFVLIYQIDQRLRRREQAARSAAHEEALQARLEAQRAQDEDRYQARQARTYSTHSPSGTVWPGPTPGSHQFTPPPNEPHPPA